MLYQANLDPIIIDCEQPPVTVAWLLRDLLTTELPKTHDQGPPIIRDALCDEQGIYFDTPVEIKEADGVFVLRIRGSVWTWDGERYLPNNEHVDVLDVEILPSGTGGSKVRVMPAFALGGAEKHIEALLARVFGGLDDAPKIPRDSERAAGNVTSTEAAGHRLAKRLDDAVDRVLEDASRLAGAVMGGAKPAMEPRAAATGEKSAEVAPASEVPAEPMDDSRMKAAKVNTAVGSAAHRAEKPDNGSLNGMPTRYSSYPIRGAGLRTRAIEEVRKAEANGNADALRFVSCTTGHRGSYCFPSKRCVARGVAVSAGVARICTPG